MRGREWLDFEVEIKVKSTTIWEHGRYYSGPEGTLFLLAILAADDPDTRASLAEVLDAVEILPLPDRGVRREK